MEIIKSHILKTKRKIDNLTEEIDELRSDILEFL